MDALLRLIVGLVGDFTITPWLKRFKRRYLFLVLAVWTVLAVALAYWMKH